MAAKNIRLAGKSRLGDDDGFKSFTIHTAASRVGPWRNAMLHLFLTPSPLLVGGEVLAGMSLPMFVAALIVAFGDRIKLNGRPPTRSSLSL
jgi:hypothetical protein